MAPRHEEPRRFSRFFASADSCYVHGLGQYLSDTQISFRVAIAGAHTDDFKWRFRWLRYRALPHCQILGRGRIVFGLFVSAIQAAFARLIQWRYLDQRIA